MRLLIIIFFLFYGIKNSIGLTNIELQEVMRTIKCTTCQGQAILESDTLAANKLKKEVYLLASKGYSKQEILENIKNNHGKDVVFLPEAEQNNFIIWLLPFVIISFGLLSFLYVIKQSRNNG